jgi:PAS domain S-box-containing protein
LENPNARILSESDIIDVLASGQDALAIFTGANFIIEYANAKMLAYWNKDESVFGLSLETVMPDLYQQTLANGLKNVWKNGSNFISEQVPVSLYNSGKPQMRLLDLKYEPVKDAFQRTYGALLRITGPSTAVVNSELQDTAAENSRLKARLNESADHFKRFVKQAPVAVMVLIGKDLIMEAANQQMLDIIHKDESILGKPILESMPELKDELAVRLLFDVFQTGKPTDGAEVPINFLKDGKSELRYFNFNYYPLLDDGQIIGVINLAVEVSSQVENRQNLEAIIAEKTELEKTLRDSKQRLQGILDTMAEGVGIIDSNGQMVYANAMAENILGLNAEQIRMRTFDDVRWQNLRLDGSPLPEEEHPMAIMMRTGLPIYDQEIGVQPPEGERLYISINAAPIFDEDGQLTGGIGTFMDVTKRRKLITQKDDFISVASHELKTPVTTLKATLQLITKNQDGKKPELLKKLIDQANKGMEKLNSLIADLLDTNRISQGQLIINKATFSLAEMLGESCQHIRHINTHQVILKGDMQIMVHADERQIEQVVINFVNNAVKYAPDSREIIIELSRLEHAARISVSDKGPGIPPEKLPHVFERYYRVDHSGVQFSGLGLGLFICAEIIKKHGGEIGVESKLGSGSTFWFTIPL